MQNGTAETILEMLASYHQQAVALATDNNYKEQRIEQLQAQLQPSEPDSGDEDV